MKNVIIIHEGFTNNYLIPGVVGLAIALVLASLSLPFGILAGFVCLVTFTGTNGLEIDPKNMEYRKYGSFFGFKIGAWLPLSNPIFAQLSISTENHYVGGMAAGGGYVPNKGKLKSLTYDIAFEDKQGKWKIVYSFLDYKMAQFALKEIESKMAIPTHDKVKEKLLINQEKRRNRGY